MSSDWNDLGESPEAATSMEIASRLRAICPAIVEIGFGGKASWYYTGTADGWLPVITWL